MNHRYRRGISMAETLVCIAIIGVVAAIVSPVLSHAKRSAKYAQTVQNLRILHTAAMLYQADEGGASFGTPEEMGLPPWLGTLRPYDFSDRYLRPWYRDMKSPFGIGKDKEYITFAYPSKIDRLSVTFSACTIAQGEKCILYWDAYVPGKDSRTGFWWATVDHARKRLPGISLSGTLVVHDKDGSPYSQAWWIPDYYETKQ